MVFSVVSSLLLLSSFGINIMKGFDRLRDDMFLDLIAGTRGCLCRDVWGSSRMATVSYHFHVLFLRLVVAGGYSCYCP